MLYLASPADRRSFQRQVRSPLRKIYVTLAGSNGRDSDKVGRIVIEVEAAEPHRIVKLQARAIPRPPDLALPHLDERELVASLHGRLRQPLAADAFSGAVLLAKNGEPIFAQAYGFADREHQIPNSLNTRFRIGSMNKMFTAVAVLQLVAAGKLRLNGPLIKYLPDYPNRELASTVTISELLGTRPALETSSVLNLRAIVWSFAHTKTTLSFLAGALSDSSRVADLNTAITGF